MQMYRTNEIIDRAKQQMLTILLLACAIMAVISPVYANPAANSQCEVSITITPNILGDLEVPEDPWLPNGLLFLIPVIFGVSGIVATWIVKSNIILAIIVLITTALGIVILAQLIIE